MLNSKAIEFAVGLFMLAGIIALLILAFKVSGFDDFNIQNSYRVKAKFDNIGGLKIRAPVKLAGVKIGEVSRIKLDPITYQATVTMRINVSDDKLPTDSSASIYTEGILGANYISIAPGYDETFLKNKSEIQDTTPALILENLIGQFMFQLKKGNDKDSSTEGTTE